MQKGDGILLESTVERRLVREVKKRGGLALKFVSPGLDGVPDRIILFANGRLGFVEVKAPGKTMRPLQVTIADQLKDLGFKVYCIVNVGMIGGILDEIQSI